MYGFISPIVKVIAAELIGVGVKSATSKKDSQDKESTDFVSDIFNELVGVVGGKDKRGGGGKDQGGGGRDQGGGGKGQGGGGKGQGGESKGSGCQRN